MPRTYSARVIIKTLQRAGFTIIGQKGSHIKMRGIRNGRICTVIVPNHKEVLRGTFSSVLRQADMSVSDFETYR